MDSAKQQVSLESILEIRQWFYHILSKYFYQEPTQQELHQLGQTNYFCELAKIQDESNNGVRLIADFIKSLPNLSESKLNKIQEEYQRIFIGTIPSSPFPWSSVYLNGDGTIFNESTLKVREFYRQWGVELDSDYKEPDDHIGLELEFVALLTKRLLDCEQNDEAKLLRLMKAQKEFLEVYLISWVEEFANKLVQSTETNFYKGLALFMPNYLRMDLDLLDDLILNLETSNELDLCLKQNIKYDSLLKLSKKIDGSISFNNYKKIGLQEVKDKKRNLKIEEKVIPTGGTNNCGGRCVIKAHVKDDIITRLSTDNKADSFETPQMKACVRGRAYRQTYFKAERLKYPLKRIGKRGEGKFKRISWEEAIETIANELNRVKEEYGPSSRYVNYAWGYNAQIQAMKLAERLLALDGGYLGRYNSYSSACTKYATPYTYGTKDTGNTPDDLVNSELIILWGHNPVETQFGTMLHYLQRAKEMGAKIIVIDPRYSDTAAALADEWVPILPTTDNAVMDAMAYVMITEDLYDKDFIDKYCLGFDKNNMPEGVVDEESYKEYILGKSDGVAKTPEWAAEISKVSAETIRRLAREYATTKPAALIQGWGPQRHAYGEQPVRGATVLAAMTGNIGINGGWASGMGSVSRQSIPSVPIPQNPFPGKIPSFLWTDAIVRGKEMGGEDGVKGVKSLPSNIKLIMNLAGNCLINQHANCNKTAEILKDEDKVEFIVVSEIFMTSSAKFADVLLPGDTFFGRNNISTPWAYGDYVIYNNKAVEPPFECRNEYDWLKDVADKLGVKAEFTDGKETMEDWCRWIVKEIQQNHPEFPSYKEFKEQGIYKWSYDEPYVAFKDQIEDLENNPFLTPSGKIEIFSKRLYDLNKPSEIPAVPKYIDAWEGSNESLQEEYPLQCIGWHSKHRCHSTHDNNVWLKEVVQQTAWMNPKDADMRGIADGDKVRVYNSRGEMIIPVKVTPRIIPGVVGIPQGAWWQPDEDGIDKRGNINTLTSQNPTPLAKGNAQHTNLVEISKV